MQQSWQANCNTTITLSKSTIHTPLKQAKENARTLSNPCVFVSCNIALHPCVDPPRIMLGSRLVFEHLSIFKYHSTCVMVTMATPLLLCPTCGTKTTTVMPIIVKTKGKPFIALIATVSPDHEGSDSDHDCRYKNPNSLFHNFFLTLCCLSVHRPF
jgi:hypothetical protein